MILSHQVVQPFETDTLAATREVCTGLGGPLGANVFKRSGQRRGERHLHLCRTLFFDFMRFRHLAHAVESKIIMGHFAWMHGGPKALLFIPTVNPAGS